MSMQDAVEEAVDSGEVQLGDRELTVVIPGPDGKPTEMKIWEPTIEQIAWISTLLSGNGRAAKPMEQIHAMTDMIQDLLDEDEFDAIWARLRNRRDPLRMEHISDAIATALESITDFPTQPSSGSSPSSPPSGPRSTGRVRGEGSTQSRSRRGGS